MVPTAIRSAIPILRIPVVAAAAAAAAVTSSNATRTTTTTAIIMVMFMKIILMTITNYAANEEDRKIRSIVVPSHPNY